MCPNCQKSNIQKYGTQNNIQRYKCNRCNKTFTLQNKLDPIKIWTDYSLGKQTYKQLAEKYACSVRTIQRYILKAPKTALKSPKNKKLNIVMDMTFFGNKFGVLVLMDSLTKTIVYHQIVEREKVIYYRSALNQLREKNFYIQSITCDGRRGLLKDIFNTPIQMCQFHQVAIIIRRLTRKQKSEAGKELKSLIKTLKTSNKKTFFVNLHHWYLKHKAFLNERSDKADENGKYPFKHRNVRSAYLSLKRNEKFLFTFEKYPELNIEKTTNRLESLFSELKRKLSVHNGLTKVHKIMFIKDFLNKKSW